MFAPAQQKQAFAKIGLYGEAGSGKTYTAAKFAIGLHQYLGLDKPVAMFDTEPAAGFIKPLFDDANIDFVVADGSRALQDVMAAIDEAEQNCSMLIIDSITHIWRDAQESYLNKVNHERRQRNMRPIYQLEFHHWRPIKAAWAAFTDRFLASKLHMIVCGRAGTIYSYQDKDDGTGKKELIQMGTRMATEKEMGYEPSLLIEMTKVLEEGKIINTAMVEKDRADQLNGKVIPMPDFGAIIPHIASLNLGGEHFGSMEDKNSEDMYSGAEGLSTFDAEKKRRTILCEEITALFVKHGLDGTSKDAKKERFALLEQTFGTAAWTAIEGMNSDLLKAGLATLVEQLEEEEVIDAVPEESEDD